MKKRNTEQPKIHTATPWPTQAHEPQAAAASCAVLSHSFLASQCGYVNVYLLRLVPKTELLLLPSPWPSGTFLCTRPCFALL